MTITEKGKTDRDHRGRTSASRLDDRGAAQAAADVSEGRRARRHHHRRIGVGHHRRRRGARAGLGDYARARGLKPLAKIIGWASAGVDPRIMGIGPVPAIAKLKERTGLGIDDFDLVEINEAFAAQVLAVLKDVPIPAEKLNVNGGAIALGHPIGCTGARIVVTLLHELQRRGKQRAWRRCASAAAWAWRWRIEAAELKECRQLRTKCALRSSPETGSARTSRRKPSRSCKSVGEVFGRRFDLEHLPWSADHYLKTGETLPANGYQMLREFDAIFVGALGDPRVADNRHARDILLGTRFELDLYVNYRPVRAARRSPEPAQGSRPEGHQLRRVPREHRRRVRQHRRPLQGRHRRRSRDPGRDQHLQGRAPHHPPRVRVREGERPHEGLHGRQEQRHAAGARAVAARVQGSRGAVSRHHRDAINTSMRWRCSS